MMPQGEIKAGKGVQYIVLLSAVCEFQAPPELSICSLPSIAATTEIPTRKSIDHLLFVGWGLVVQRGHQELAHTLHCDRRVLSRHICLQFGVQ